MVRPPPRPPLFPYTTLFRSLAGTSNPGRSLQREFHTCNSRPLAASRIATSGTDRKSTRLNSSHRTISYAVFCLTKKELGREDIRHDDCTNQVGANYGNEHRS